MHFRNFWRNFFENFRKGPPPPEKNPGYDHEIREKEDIFTFMSICTWRTWFIFLTGSLGWIQAPTLRPPKFWKKSTSPSKPPKPPKPRKIQILFLVLSSLIHSREWFFNRNMYTSTMQKTLKFPLPRCIPL